MARERKTKPTTEQQDRVEERREKRREEVGERQAAAEQARSDAITEANRAHISNPGAVKDAHGEIAQVSRSGSKVTVGLKLGVAYFDIQLSKLTTKMENTQTGPREIREATRYGRPVRLRGTAYPRGTPPLGFPPPPDIVAGAAMNYGIDEDFWNQWVEQHERDPLVMNGLIFAHKEIESVKAQALAERDNVSGLDPINPINDPRKEKSTRTDVANVETEESRAVKMQRLNTN